MRNVIFAISCCVAACGFAAPRVLNVTMPQPQYLSTFEETITIGYDLEGETSIVTLDILTNGVSIGAANVVSVSGDVNKKVEPGTGKSIVWQAYQDWPDHKITDKIVQAKVTAWALDNPPDVMVVDLLTKSNIVFYASLASLPGGVANDLYKTDKLVMRKIPAGGCMFTMGEIEGANARRPHLVAFTNDFYLGVYEVTQKQMYNVSGERGTVDYSGRTDSDLLPCDAIRWYGDGGTACRIFRRLQYSAEYVLMRPQAHSGNSPAAPGCPPSSMMARWTMLRWIALDGMRATPRTKPRTPQNHIPWG